MMWNDGWGGGGWLVMSFLMVAFWVLVIVGVVWLVRGSDNRQPPTPPMTPPQPPGWSARQILDERFARGEISEEEYRHRRSVLDQR